MTKLAPQSLSLSEALPIGGSFVRRAEIVALGGDGAVSVRIDGLTTSTATMALELGAPLGVGDVVVVAGEGEQSAFVIGLIARAEAPIEQTVRATSGASATLTKCDGDERIEIRDAEARVVFELDAKTGRATLRAPKGDLTLCAPNGDITLEAGGRLSLAGATVAVRASRFDGLITEARLVASRVESVSDEVFERAKSVYRRIDDLYQLRAGRTRTLVSGGAALKADHVSIEAEDDVRIDGKQIHLG